ncbi:MAG: ABC transporter permease [Firmicutes bacterium]|nr:ABC transporter permease [Bacillota bacterium]
MGRFTLKRKHMVIPYALFMAMFIVVPLIIIAIYAFTDKNFNFTFDNFVKFFTDSESVSAFIYSVWIGLLTTVICLIIGFPIAYILSTKKFFRTGGVFIVLFILPMWINFLLRTLAIREILTFLEIPFGELTTVIGMVYNFLPFMILPIYTVLLKMDRSYIEAAQDLGANSFKVFTKVIIPLSVPGIISGVIMVFMPTISTFVIADLLSRNTLQFFGNLIHMYFMQTPYWNYGAALAFIMLIIIGVAMFFVNKSQKDDVASLKGGIW